MTSHNLDRWVMPSTIEEYIDLFNGADKSKRTFDEAIGSLEMSLVNVRENPQLLIHPGGNWPTQDQLRALYLDAHQKAGIALAKYNSLAVEHREHVRAPNEIGRDQGSRSRGRP